MRFERARWRCRRGMKELDVLLERFARHGLDRLGDDEIEALERLLGQPDQDILEWIVSPAATPPAGMRGIVELVRAHALGRAEITARPPGLQSGGADKEEPMRSHSHHKPGFSGTER